MIDAKVFLDRRGLWAFVVGCMATTAVVLLHMPMYMMGKDTGFRLAGLPMDNVMLFGMYLIVAGVALAAYGLLPKNIAQTAEAASHISVTAPEDVKLGPETCGLDLRELEGHPNNL